MSNPRQIRKPRTARLNPGIANGVQLRRGYDPSKDNRPTLAEHHTRRAASHGVSYSDKLAGEIVALTAEGFTMSEIANLRGFPGLTAMCRWMVESEHFAEQMLRARENAIQLRADELLEIADAATPENVDVAKLRIEVRKWLLSKLAWRVYGDRVGYNDGAQAGGKFVLTWQGEEPPTIEQRKLIDVTPSKAMAKGGEGDKSE
jgi:hypothetical protein